jgi:predicted DNA-binding transcriptional regulator YafY
MNRMDRLYALAEELRAVAPRRRTAAWLAAKFEVSVRTIERDLGALAEAGVPVYGDRGHGGGYAIDRARTLPPLNVTPAEAAAAAVALRRLAGTPFRAAAGSLLRKVLAAMPAGDVARAESLARRVFTAPAAPTEIPAPICDAVATGRPLKLRYVDKHGTRTTRVVDPVGYIEVGDAWFLHARCRLRGDLRVFRIANIETVEVAAEPVALRVAQIGAHEPGLERHRAGVHLPAQLHRLLARRRDVGDDDHEDGVAGHRAAGGEQPAPQRMPGTGDDVAVVELGQFALCERPAEQTAVERLRRVGVGRADLEPADCSGAHHDDLPRRSELIGLNGNHRPSGSRQPYVG